MSKLTQTSIVNGQSFVASGFLGGLYAWKGSVTDTITSYSGDYSAYFGALSDEANLFAGTVWSNATLAALGAPYFARGLANWTSGNANAAVETIAYTFTTPLPAGQSFLLWDPGASLNGANGPYTFQIAAKNNG